MYRSILVPLDGSPLSEHALPLAQDLARQTGAVLRLAHVHIPPTVPMYSADLPLFDAGLDDQTSAQERAYLTALAARLADETDIAVERLRQQLITTPQFTRFHDVVEQVFLHNQAFHVISAEGGAFEVRVLIVATGVLPRPLGVLGEQRLMGYGLSYSATSHAHLFAGRRVAVVGSDLRALRAAADLSAIADHVTLIIPTQLQLSSYRLGQRLLHADHVTLLANYIVQEITGTTAATGLVVVAPGGTRQHIAVDGIFIEHGLIAQSGFLGSLVERTSSGQIVVDERGATSCPGLFAAGDVTSSAYAEQILIALGEGTRAGLSARAYLLEQAIGSQEHLHEQTIPQG